jgi:hypothetical protein
MPFAIKNLLNGGDVLAAPPLRGRAAGGGGQHPLGAGRRYEGAPARRAGAPIPSSH